MKGKEHKKKNRDKEEDEGKYHNVNNSQYKKDNCNDDDNSDNSDSNDDDDANNKKSKKKIKKITKQTKIKKKGLIEYINNLKSCIQLLLK